MICVSVGHSPLGKAIFCRIQSVDLYLTSAPPATIASFTEYKSKPFFDFLGISYEQSKVFSLENEMDYLSLNCRFNGFSKSGKHLKSTTKIIETSKATYTYIILLAHAYNLLKMPSQ